MPRQQAVEGRTALRLLELGCNRIRDLSGLGELQSLEQLWLGRNRIDRITGLDGCDACTRTVRMLYGCERNPARDAHARRRARGRFQRP